MTVVSLVVSIYPLTHALLSLLYSPPVRRIKRCMRHLETHKFEGFMQRLQTEVNLIVDLVNTVNAFTRSQTRLFVYFVC